jgi:hypothetical protein
MEKTSGNDLTSSGMEKNQTGRSNQDRSQFWPFTLQLYMSPLDQTCNHFHPSPRFTSIISGAIGNLCFLEVFKFFFLDVEYMLLFLIIQYISAKYLYLINYLAFLFWHFIYGAALQVLWIWGK